MSLAADEALLFAALAASRQNALVLPTAIAPRMPGICLLLEMDKLRLGRLADEEARAALAPEIPVVVMTKAIAVTRGIAATKARR